MPKIAEHLGLAVCMYYNDHPPPHVHVRGAEIRARIEIESGEFLDGDECFKSRDAKSLTSWVVANSESLSDAWAHASTGTPLPSYEWTT